MSPRFSRALVAALASCWSSAGATQETPQGAPAPPAQTEPSAAQPPGRKSFGEEIVVTGSRIRRKDLTTPAPVTVITRDEIALSGRASLGEVLQQIPEQGNAMNTQFNNGGDGSTNVALRGMFAHRTLVLLNGRRFVNGGNGANMAVDLSSLPAAAVERIEILKDGASAIYGADAIAGVVNVITRRGWSGTEVEAYAGTSSRRDATTYDVKLAHGRTSDTGSLLLTMGYTDDRPAMAGDRAFSRNQYMFDSTGMGDSQFNPLQLSGLVPAGDYRTPMATFRNPGRPVDNPGNDPMIARFNDLVAAYPDVSRFVLDPSAPLGWRPWLGVPLPPLGDGYNYQPENYLVTPQRRLSLFASGDQALGSRSRAFVEASFTNRQSAQKIAPAPLGGLTVAANNAYNPFGVELSRVRRRLVEAGDRAFTQNVDTYRVVAGLDGTLPPSLVGDRSWTWELSFAHGSNQSSQTVTGYPQLSKVRQALGPSYNGQCSTDGTAAGVIAGCTPLDILGMPGSITPAQLQGLTYVGVDRGANSLTSAQSAATGELLNLFSDRPVSLALGYEYRLTSGLWQPDPMAIAGESLEGTSTAARGSSDVHELYGELAIPVLSGFPLAEEVEIMAAARGFKYSGFAAGSTWKLGARWLPVRDVTIRGTVSTGYRAPGVPELFQGVASGVDTVLTDPCASPSAPSSCGSAAGIVDPRTGIPFQTGGNAKLRPEASQAFTAGVVLEPRWLRGLTITADYYRIAIRRVIGEIGWWYILDSCYPSAPDRTPLYCSLVHRDPVTQLISFIDDTSQNFATEEAAGLDLAVRYALPTLLGRFALHADGTWTQYHDITMSPNSTPGFLPTGGSNGAVLHAKGTFDLGALYPALKVNAGLGWSLAGLGASVGARFLSASRECAYSNGFYGAGAACSTDSTYVRSISSYTVWDTLVSYQLASGLGRTTLTAGMRNLFDRQPPLVLTSYAYNTDPAAYDAIGRYVYLRLSHRL